MFTIVYIEKIDCLRIVYVLFISDFKIILKKILKKLLFYRFLFLGLLLLNFTLMKTKINNVILKYCIGLFTLIILIALQIFNRPIYTTEQGTVQYIELTNVEEGDLILLDASGEIKVAKTKLLK